ncbi:DNA polymerase III subunit gamma/tau [bacterium NHP-B]|nr:DNA polymerase III subunit gamma/tau [bacterium NHP-B]
MPESYRVLAHRLRPKRFQDLVGQDIFITLIQKAFLKKRLASGFLLTGIRGVGKTTIARLLAKTMNCQNPLHEEASIEPCGQCSSCEALDAGNHTDIMEMDAASHTGVDDIRRILDTCQYTPLQGAYKIFIIDEVHMLSKSAFNALLKTLEAPPSHVKFIFATTEVEKIPLTVMSRCLRFDLRRIDRRVMFTYLKEVCENESVEVEEAALHLIVEVSDGSLRDALSILEQGLLLAHQDEGSPHISEAAMQTLLGMQSTQNIQDTLTAVLEKDAAAAIQTCRRSYEGGSDPVMFLDQMATLVYRVSLVKTAQMTSLDDALYRHFQDQAFLAKVAQHYELSVLGRLWQMLLKGRQELLHAAFPQQHFEMLLIRLAYASQLPTPEKLFTLLQQEREEVNSPPKGGDSLSRDPDQGHRQHEVSPRASSERGGLSLQATPPLKDVDEVLQKAHSASTVSLEKRVKTGQEILDLLHQHREGLLHTHFVKGVEVVSLDDPHLTIATVDLPTSFSHTLQTFLSSKTGRPWRVEVTDKKGEVLTLEAARAQQKQQDQKEVESLPLVKKAKDVFGPDVRAVVKEARPK